jgi:hypothetical protein
VTPALVGLAVAAVTGSVVAVSVRDGRIAILGLVVALLVAPLLGDPQAAPLGLAARYLGAVLAGYLLWMTVRGGQPTSGSRLGWPAEALTALGAAVVGYGTHGLGLVPGGPAEAQAAGFALLALALAPIVTGRDIVRIGIGLVLMLLGVGLVRVALVGTPTVLEELTLAGLVAALGGVVALLSKAALGDGPGGFALAGEAGRVRPRDDRRDAATTETPPTRGPR